MEELYNEQEFYTKYKKILHDVIDFYTKTRDNKKLDIANMELNNLNNGYKNSLGKVEDCKKLGIAIDNQY